MIKRIAIRENYDGRFLGFSLEKKSLTILILCNKDILFTTVIFFRYSNYREFKKKIVCFNLG